MRSEGQAEALKFGEEIFLVIDWGTGRREKEGAGIVWARYAATHSSSNFLRAFNNLPRIISPSVSLAAVPSSPHLPFVLLTPHTHAVRPEGS